VDPAATASIDPEPKTHRRWEGSGWQLMLWLGLLVAFSPVWPDLLELLIEQPWSRVALVFPWLAWMASREDSGRSAPTAWGRGLLVFGLAFELLAIGADVVRVARLGLGVAAVGLCLAGGWTSVRVALLLLWAVPMPASLLNQLGPMLARLHASVADWTLSTAGLAVDRLGTGGLRSGGEELVLGAADGGLQSMVAFAGFGWFWATRRGAPMTGLLRGAGGWALSALPLQMIVVTTAGAAFAAGASADRVRAALDLFSWLGVMAIGLAPFLWQSAANAPVPSCSPASPLDRGRDRR